MHTLSLSSLAALSLVVAPTALAQRKISVSPHTVTQTSAAGIQTIHSTNRPLSSVVAVTLASAELNAAPGIDISSLVRFRLGQHVVGKLPNGVQFPLANDTTDTVRTISDLRSDVLIKWLDPLTRDRDPNAPHFGANCDYIAFFGEGWDRDWLGGRVNSAPQWNGSGSAGWMWVNHEYISNSAPSLTSAPNGQMLTFAMWLRDNGILKNNVQSNVWTQKDLDTFTHYAKTMLGGSWLRIYRDVNGTWQVDLDSRNRRYDSTSATQLTITGYQLAQIGLDHDDAGADLPEGVVTGTNGNCSGGQSPWGTIFSAEENVQSYYGDLEAAWNSSQKFLVGNGFDAGTNINPIVESTRTNSFGSMSTVQDRHNRDVYGFMSEFDVGISGDAYYMSANNNGNGMGHRKLGAMGRARWENATFATDANWKLVPDQPVVIYGGNDRRSGRIWKFVSSENYVDGMTKSQVRALLDTGRLYVAHFAGLDNTTGLTLLRTKKSPEFNDPGKGQWLHISVDSTDTAPNAMALGKPGTTIGQALKDPQWNGIGAFPDDNSVLSALFTAATKVGVMELNRPEDLEWNPRDLSGQGRLYVAFTNNGRQVALDQNGKLYDPATHATNSPRRPDPYGAIFAMQEANWQDPAKSMTFDYWAEWLGRAGTGLYDAANPDNLMIDQYGGVWFGTDGNFGRNGRADAAYYLDLDPSHAKSAPGVVNPTYREAIRVVAGPSDSEATGPCLSADMKSFFFAVQHPGENFSSNQSTWPQQR